MAKSNALTEWLGIPAEEQPPSYYRLLELKLFVSDRARIDAAADKAVARVERFAGEKHADVGRKLVEKIEAARACLLNADRKAEYDAKLRASMGMAAEKTSVADSIPEPVELSEVVKIQSNESSVTERRNKKSSQPMALYAAVLGGLVAIAVAWFAGVLPFGKKGEKPKGDPVVQNDKTTPPKKTRPPKPTKKTSEPNVVVRKTNDQPVPDKTGNQIAGRKKPPTDGKTVPVHAGNGKAASLDAVDYTAFKPLTSHGTWEDLPSFLEGASVYSVSPGTKRTIPAREIAFTAKEAGIVVMLASWTYDGNKQGGWHPTRTTAEMLKQNGWKILGNTTLVGEDKSKHAYSVYAREFKAGEKARLHTRKYSPPILVKLHAERSNAVVAAMGDEAAGGAGIVDLSNKIDLKRDILRGTWNVSNGTITTPGSDFAQLLISRNAPHEFELRFKARRKGLRGSSSLTLGLWGGDRPFMAFLDYGDKHLTGLSRVDGKKLGDSPSTKANPQLFKEGVQAEVVCRVQKSGIRIIIDGKTVIDWSDYSRLSYPPHWKTLEENQISLGADCPFEISEIKLHALKKKTASRTKGSPKTKLRVVNLLNRIEPARNAVKGKWALKGGKLVSQGARFARLQIPYEPGSEYELHVTATRLAEARDPGLNIGLVGGGKNFAVMFEHPGQLNGLHQLDDQRLNGNVTAKRARVLKTKKPVNIVCKVKKGGVYVSVDGRKIVDWKGDFKRLSPYEFYKVPNERQLWIGGDSPFEFSKIELRTRRTIPIAGTGIAVPDADKQQKSLALIKDIFKKEYIAATSATGQIALAKKLKEQSHKQADDVTARFVLLAEAKRLALEADYLKLAFEVIEETAGVYAIDERKEKIAALKSLAARVRSNSRGRDIVNAAVDLAQAAYKDERFEESLDLLRIGSRVASKFRMRTLAKRLTDTRSAVVERQRLVAKIQAAEKTLQSKPDDPQANLLLGRYHAFTKNDFTTGLPHLAKGDDAKLKQLATKEQTNPTEPLKMVELADAWWDYSRMKSVEKEAATGAVVRAVTWYRHALPSLTGLYKTKVEKRLAEIKRLKLLPPGVSIGTISPVKKRAVVTPNVKPKKHQPIANAPLYVWEIISTTQSPAKGHLRLGFLRDGSTSTGEKWKIEGTKIAYGHGATGRLIGDGRIATGRWAWGYLSARLVMKNASLQSAATSNVVLSKTAGHTQWKGRSRGPIEETAVDCWEFLATTRGNKNYIRLSVDLTEDHRVIDAGRLIGNWSVKGRKIEIKFVDRKFNTIAFNMKNTNEGVARKTTHGDLRWSCRLTRVQTVAVYKTNSIGTIRLFTNGRVNAPRHGKGLDDFHWFYESPKTLRMREFFITVSDGGRIIIATSRGGGKFEGTLVSGQPLPATKP